MMVVIGPKIDKKTVQLVVHNFDEQSIVVSTGPARRSLVHHHGKCLIPSLI